MKNKNAAILSLLCNGLSKVSRKLKVNSLKWQFWLVPRQPFMISEIQPYLWVLSRVPEKQTKVAVILYKKIGWASSICTVLWTERVTCRRAEDRSWEKEASVWCDWGTVGESKGIKSKTKRALKLAVDCWKATWWWWWWGGVVWSPHYDLVNV